MTVVLIYGESLPVVKVGRLAGQFAKPRSSDVERQGRNSANCRPTAGDIVNGIEFEAEARVPDPARMIQAYNQSAATMNLVRAFALGGFADLHQVNRWTQDFVRDDVFGRRYLELAERITEALDFMAACGVDASTSPHVREASVFTSHEGLLLALRAGVDATGQPDRRLVRLFGAHAVDRRPDAPARRRPCRVPARGSATRSA